MFTRIMARLPLGTRATVGEYRAVDVEDSDDDDDEYTDGGYTVGAVDADKLVGWRVCWMWFPALFDSKPFFPHYTVPTQLCAIYMINVISYTGIPALHDGCMYCRTSLTPVCGTTLMNVGLILTPVSIYQMSRGALVLWVGILSVIFLRRRLWLYQWTSLIIVTLGVCLVGLSGSLVKKELNNTPMGEEPSVAAAFVRIAERAEDDPAKVALGVMLILFAQIFTASQYVRNDHLLDVGARWKLTFQVVEEKIMSRYKVEPLAAVSLEGFFGLITTLTAMPFLHLFFRTKSPYFDIPRGWHQIINTPTVYWSCVAIMVSIGAFNFFGLSVTSRVSATTRSTIDTCRTLGIWVVSLGLGWEKLVWPFLLLQVAGFGMLV